MNNPKICELMNINIDEPFNIIGQKLSNPYTFKRKESFIFLVNSNNEEAHNWVICKLIEGTLHIDRNNK